MMILKGVREEDFVNYYKPHMFLAFPYCTFKCDKECGKQICQNSNLAKSKNIEVSETLLCEKYINNPITKSIVCGGLEPMDSFDMLFNFIVILREKYKNEDDFVIYTGYTEEECQQNEWLSRLKRFKNIIIKFGRFYPNEDSHLDEVLGIKLASHNQYARRIS